MRGRAAFAHFDRAASDPIDQLEAEFIGEIVADEHREATPERSLREELRDRRALVLSARLDFHHHFSRLQLEVVAELLDQPAEGLAYRRAELRRRAVVERERKSTRLNSSHSQISYAVFCLKKKKKT